ncbi:MAG: DUF4342 domain-containing protein [Clostridia bacterium]|nr:DUF4342 domain-containing protein [Clostridia bacterium]
MTHKTYTTYKNGISAFLFGNRILITKETKTAIDLPLLAGIIIALCLTRLTLFAAIIALVLGYKFTIRKNDSASFDGAVQDAADKVKAAVCTAADKIKSAMGSAAAQVKDAVCSVEQEIQTAAEAAGSAEDHA